MLFRSLEQSDSIGEPSGNEASLRLVDRMRIKVAGENVAATEGHPCLREKAGPAADVEGGAGRQTLEVFEAHRRCGVASRAETFTGSLDELSDSLRCGKMGGAPAVPARHNHRRGIRPGRNVIQGTDGKAAAGECRRSQLGGAPWCAYQALVIHGYRLERAEIGEGVSDLGRGRLHEQTRRQRGRLANLPHRGDHHSL